MCAQVKEGKLDSNDGTGLFKLFGSLSPTKICEKYDDGDPGMSGGAIAGIVIGVILVLAIIGGGVWYFKKKNN